MNPQQLEALNTAIDETAEYIEAFPHETKETYAARRAELQEAAAPVTEFVAAIFAEIAAAEEAKANGEQPEGEEEEDDGEDDEWDQYSGEEEPLPEGDDDHDEL